MEAARSFVDKRQTRPLVFEPAARVWTFGPWLILALAATAGLLAPSVSWRLAAWPFLISAALVGMPHGALDLRLWLQGPQAPGQRLAVALKYMAGIVASVTVLMFSPRVALIGFGVITAIHFGFADTRHAALAVRGIKPARKSLWLLGVGRGSLVLALPFVWSPAQAIEPAALAMTMLGGNKLSVATSLCQIAGMGVLALSFVLIIGGIVSGSELGHSQQHAENSAGSGEDSLIFHLLEMALLAAAAAVLSPMFFVGTYFFGWHALRHFGFVKRWTEPPVQTTMRSLTILHLWSVPLLAPTLTVYFLLGSWLIGWQQPMAWATLLLLFFAVLTPSHHWLVERSTRRAGQRC
jgi:Brp/Blh family beta-carotene 15,15'-monooxygenase